MPISTPDSSSSMPIVGDSIGDSLQIQSLFTAPVINGGSKSPYKKMFSSKINNNAGFSKDFLA